MNKEQTGAWRKAERISLAERKRLLEDTRRDVVDLLGQAKQDITLLLAGQASDYTKWRLTELNKEVDRVMGEFSSKAGQALSTGAGRAWDGGIAQIEKPLSAVGITASTVHLDGNQLMAMRTFMVDRISDVGSATASRIKQALGLTMIGSQSIPETIEQVAGLVDGGKARASTIVRTELSRAWAFASHERALQSAREGIEMDKVWRRSGKLFPRQSHLLADGRRVPVNEAFDINGHKLRFPHDPKAPASETINCGCVCLYRPRSIKATLPDKRPFTKEELAMNPDMAQLANGPSLKQLLKTGLSEMLAVRAKEIASATIEHSSAYSMDGHLLFNKSGDASSIEFNAAELSQLNDAVLLHNHPLVPASFSVDDVKLAVWHDLAETHVVDRLYHYEIIRPETANWGPAYWAKTLRPIVERVTAEVELQLDTALQAGQITKDQYLSLIDHMVWDRVNTEADLGYQRTLRTEK